jgi:ribosomal-protein-alanine N-acetyltransferase
MFPQHLETERLTLRPPTVADAPALFKRYTQDADVTRFLSWAPHTAVEQTELFLAEAERFWREGVKFPWALVNKEDQSLMGMIELRLDTGVEADGRRAEVGYVLARDAWGQGYMTEALQGVIAMALAPGKLTRIWAKCDVCNTASARVLERAGMVVEGQLRRHAVHPNLGSDPRDSVIYAIVR